MTIDNLFILAFVIHVYACTFMTGVIWIIQLVHYPMFKDLELSTFNHAMKRHQKGMSKVVLAIMLIELFSGVALITLMKGINLAVIINLLILVVIWVITFLVSVPCHSRLLVTKSSDTINRLVLTNWPRTLLWSGRSLCLMYFLTSYLVVTL